jgi:antirestriction protein ArdC
VQQQLHPSKEAKMKNIYQTVTDQIIEQLEKGARPWCAPWNTSHMEGRVVLPLRHNGVPYQGVNILTLWMATMEKGYRASVWMTFKQALDLGGAVRKGEKSSLTVYADKITRAEAGQQNGDQQAREIHFMKGYQVFNAEQIDGLPDQYYVKPEAPMASLTRNARAEAFFAATGADIRHGGSEAYYSTGFDYIQMPLMEGFRDAEAYYATLAHEATHYAAFRIMPH